jgi:flagellar hook assembly protein FlgD
MRPVSGWARTLIYPNPFNPRTTIWDGQDDKGRAVPTGTYFGRLSTAQGSQTRNLTRAR